MKKVATILLVIWIVGCSYYYVCHIKHHCDCTTINENSQKEEIATPVPGMLTISDGDWNASFNEEDIFFLHDGDSLIVQGDGINAMDSLANYLNTHDRELTINGFYGMDETYPDPNSNLGLARSKALANYLISKGADSTKINHSFEQTSGLNIKGEKVIYPFGLNFTPFFNLDNNNPETMAQVEDYLAKNTNKYIYFQSGSSIMDITPELHEYLNNMTYYLKFHPDKSVEAIGHTDNVGMEANNERLGLQRAKDVANYLYKIGVGEGQVKTSSKGSQEPIGDNSTEEGKAKNRRVELKLQ